MGFVFLVAPDPARMLANHLGEHEDMEQHEYEEGPPYQDPEQPPGLVQESRKTDVHDVRAGNEPHDAGDEQKFVGRNLQQLHVMLLRCALYPNARDAEAARGHLNIIGSNSTGARARRRSP